MMLYLMMVKGAYDQYLERKQAEEAMSRLSQTWASGLGALDLQAADQFAAEQAQHQAGHYSTVYRAPLFGADSDSAPSEELVGKVTVAPAQPIFQEAAPMPLENPPVGSGLAACFSEKF